MGLTIAPFQSPLSSYDDERLGAQDKAIQSISCGGSENVQAEIIELLTMAHGHLQDIETIKHIPETSCALISILKQLEIMDLKHATKDLVYHICHVCEQYVQELRTSIDMQKSIHSGLTDILKQNIVLVEERIELIQRFSQALAKKVSLDLKDYPALQGVGQGLNKKSLK